MKHHSPQFRGIRTAIVLLAFTGSATAQDPEFFISGYGNLHYMDHSGLPAQAGAADLDNGQFQLREFSLFLDFPIDDNLVASTEIEIAENGSEFTANYAYLDIQAAESFTIRAGKYLVPFLDYNENKPNYKQSLMSQPFTAWITTPVNGTPIVASGFGWSDAGVMMDWVQEAGDAGLVSLKAGVMNGLQSSSDDAFDFNDITLVAGPTIRPRDGIIQNEAGLTDNNNNKAIVAKLTYQDLNSPLNTGLSLYQGKWDSADSKDLQMLGIHANWVAERYSFKGEYSLNNVEQDAGVLVPGAPGLNTTTGDYEMEAFYLEATYTPIVWTEERWIKFILRYDAADSNDEAAFTPFRRDRWTGGLEWQFSDGARFRVEYQKHKIDDFDMAPAPYIASGGEEDIEMLMFSVVFWF